MISATAPARRLLAYIVVMERECSDWTFDSAARHMGVYSKQTIARLLRQLCERGHLTRFYGKYFSTPAGRDSVPSVEGFRFIPAPHRHAIGVAA